MNKWSSRLLLAASLVTSLTGVAAFILIFIPQFNIFWLILSPVILSVYQIPAVLLFSLYKKTRAPSAEIPPDSEKEGISQKNSEKK